MVRLSFVRVLKQVPIAIRESLQLQRKEDGLLHDVEEIYEGNRHDGSINYPSVWIVESKTEPYNKQGLGKNSTEYTASTYEFYAIDFDSEDPHMSYLKSRELAMRVGMALEKEALKQKIDGVKLFDLVKFNGLYPTGYDIVGASDRLNQACIVYDFIFRRSRFHCV